MKKFMVLYMAPWDPAEKMGGNPEEMAKMMEPWMAWKDKIGDALVDFGTPLLNGEHVSKDSSSKTSTQITGYSVLQADDLEAVKALMADHPYMSMPDCSFEVFEMMPM